jgi:arylsulfatase A-like enzyme
MSDQHRAGLSSRYDYPLDTSPTLDRLAANGVGFDCAYTTQPVCAPARTSLLTGRWPHSHRVTQNSEFRQAFYQQDIFDVAKLAGYKTGLVGKNHTYVQPEKLTFWREYNDLVGWQPPNPPPDLVEFDNWRRHLNFRVAQEVTPFPVETQFPYRIVSNAIEFLQRFGDVPFLLEVSFTEPHDPEQVPAPYWNMFPPDQVPDRCAGPEALKHKDFGWQWMRGLQEYTHPGYDDNWRRYVSNYLGSVRMIDDQLARLMGYLEEHGLREKTLVVYTADHGDFTMDYGLMRKGVGMPEALTRIPMVWSGPGIQVREPYYHACVSIADVMPTLCEAIGSEIPVGVQGRSLLPLLQGKQYPEEEFRSIYVESGFGGLYFDASDRIPYSAADFRGLGKYIVSEQEKTFDELNLVTQSGYMKMVRMGDWKLLYDMMGNGQLYHLTSDPCELKNLFGDPSIVDMQLRLLEELLRWTIRTQDSLPVPTTHGQRKKAAGTHNWYSH